MSPGGTFCWKLHRLFDCFIPVAWKRQSQSLNYLNHCLFQTLKISPDHAEVWAAPHQALGGVPEDRAVLCSGEPPAGGAWTYPSRAAAPRERQGTLRALGRPGRMWHGFIPNPGSDAWSEDAWSVLQNCWKQLLSNCDLRGEILLTFSPLKIYKQPGATKSILKSLGGGTV